MKTRQLINEDWKSVLASADLKTIAVFNLIIATCCKRHPNSTSYVDLGISVLLSADDSNIREYLNSLFIKHQRQLNYDMHNFTRFNFRRNQQFKKCYKNVVG